MRISKFVVSTALALALPFSANAAVFNLAATLTPGAEVPPVVAPGAFGSAAMAIDDVTGMFTWIITFGGLTGPATVAHFHEAPVGVAGGVVLNLNDGTDSNGAPVFNADINISAIGQDNGIFSGTAILGASAVDAVLTNNWYINIHTAANGAGEIRGQVLGGVFSPIPLPAAAWLFLSALAGLLIIRRPMLRR